MKKPIQAILTGLALSLPLWFFASCDLTGPQGEPGEKGLDAIVRDTAWAVNEALEAKTGGDPWLVAVSRVDISDADVYRHVISGVCAGIEEGDIELDLSGCYGATFARTDGVNRADKLRIVSLSFPETLTHIVDGSQGSGAFQGYTNLARVSAPGLTYIGEYAFYSAEGSIPTTHDAMTDVDFPNVLEVGDYAFNCPNIASISLPRVVRIGAYALRGDGSPNSLLTELNLPRCEEIGDYAFYTQQNLASLSLPELRTIGNSAFRAASTGQPNTALTGLSLPKCESIGDSAFAYYQNLASLELPAVTSIGSSAFAAPPGTAPGTTTNTSLTTVDLPELVSLGASAFQYYTAIARINLPKVTSIGNSAFAASTASPNTAATKADLPAVTSFGYMVFNYCTGFESLKLGPEVPTGPTAAARGIFLQTASGTGTGTTITISVPLAQKDAYETAGWKDAASAGNAAKYGTNHKAIVIDTYTTD